MADYRQLTSSFFSSPKLFHKNPNETESITSSPTSILDSKPFSCLKKNPFVTDPKTPKSETKNPYHDKPDSRVVSLGLVEALIDEKPDPNSSKPNTRMVLFGSQLKIQVPPLPPSVLFSPNESPRSPVDFGIKTRNSHVFGPFSPSPVKKSPFSSSNSGLLTSLSASEIELSEDYTCVISYGPNPKTTHIFDDCVVESCCGVVKLSESRKEGIFVPENRSSTSFPSESFLSFCCSCKKNLGQGKDIYMYRGEKAFCSSECRYREMMLEDDDDEVAHPETSDTEDVYGTFS